MKKLITLYVLISFAISFNAFSHTLSGEYSNDGSATPSYYTKIKWEISYSFTEKNGLFYIKFYNPKIKVPNYALYHDEFGKEYSLADLNLSVWPAARQLPFAMMVKVNISDGFNNYESSSSCNSNFTCNENYIADKVNLKNVSIGNFRVTDVSYFHANLGGEPAMDAILKGKRQSENKSANASSNTTARSSTTTGQSSATTTASAPSKSSYLIDSNSIDLNNSTQSVKAQNTQAIVQASATVLGGLVDQMNANYDKKMARLQAESDARLSASVKREKLRFESFYLPLINLANKGNETAQIILYLESDNFLREKVPLREEWFNKALDNKNPIALLARINSEEGGGYAKNNKILIELADAGNIDAMVMLGLWYSQRGKRPSYFWKKNIYSNESAYMTGGANEELAIKYLNMAAKNGSPNAMYYLGEIYNYGKIGHIYYPIKFKIKKNEELAFEWYSKSIIPEYKESLYQFHHVTNCYYEGSTFKWGSYTELAIMYKKGKVVNKDLTKAAEFERLSQESYDKWKNSRGPMD